MTRWSSSASVTKEGQWSPQRWRRSVARSPLALRSRRSLFISAHNTLPFAGPLTGRSKCTGQAGYAWCAIGKTGNSHQGGTCIGKTMSSIKFILSVVAFGFFLSSVIGSSTIWAQNRLPTPIARPAAKDAPVTGRTSTEKAIDESDRQLGRKLNVCRRC